MTAPRATPRKSRGQALFERMNPWSIGSVCDWGLLTDEQRNPWEAEALKPEVPEVPLEQLQFAPPESFGSME